jgi:hypothetical protein
LGTPPVLAPLTCIFTTNFRSFSASPVFIYWDECWDAMHVTNGQVLSHMCAHISYVGNELIWNCFFARRGCLSLWP